MNISSASLESSNNNEAFQVVGTDIIAPNGQEFIAHGININGPGYDLTVDIPAAIDDIVDRWHFNAIRLNLKVIEPEKSIAENEIEQIVNLYTDRGVVVVLEVHDKTGEYFTGSELDQLETWWREQAREYKDNPYVWFNISNEPGGFTSSAPENISKWINQHQTVIDAIREENANNIIVADAHYWGQDVGDWKSDLVKEKNSVILSHADKLKDPQNNLVFSVHIYDQWEYGVAQIKVPNYFNRVQAAGLPIIIGEYGAKSDGSFQETVHSLLEVANQKNISRFAWSWDSKDDIDLTTSGDGGGKDSMYNSNNEITNLTWFGQQIISDNLNL